MMRRGGGGGGVCWTTGRERGHQPGNEGRSWSAERFGSLPKLFTMALAARGLLATAVLVALAASHAAAADDIT